MIGEDLLLTFRFFVGLMSNLTSFIFLLNVLLSILTMLIILELVDLQSTHTRPWLFTGDLNATRRAHGKIKGNCLNKTSCDDFNS